MQPAGAAVPEAAPAVAPGSASGAPLAGDEHRTKITLALDDEDVTRTIGTVLTLAVIPRRARAYAQGRAGTRARAPRRARL